MSLSRLCSFWIVCACVFAFAAALPTAVVHAEDADEAETDWRRHPLASVPQLSQPPTIDGEVARREWLGATHIGPLRQNAYGYADQYARDVYLGYDDERLYIGFRLERPRETPQPTVPDETGNIGWGGGDFVEIFISPDRTTERGYAFVIYPNGAYGDGRLTPSTDRGWTADWQREARVTDTGWEGEVAIPFEALGLDGAPREGEVWGLDFIDNRRTPYRAVSHWGYRAQWHDMASWGRIRFGGESPAVRFTSAGDAGEGSEPGERTVRTVFELANATDTAAEIDARIEMLRRRDGTGDQSYFQLIDGAAEFADDEDADFEMTTTLEGLIADALQMYDRVGGDDQPQHISVPAGERRALEVVESASPGEFVALFRFTDSATGEPLGKGATPFRVDMPLALSLAPYWLNAERMMIEADLSKVAVPEEGSLTVAILDEAQEQTFAERTLEVSEGDFSAELELPVDAMDPGFYQVRATLRDAEGNELARNDEAIERPETPEWHDNDYGKQMEVSHPWTPLEATGDGVVEMWGRRYELGDVFASRIVSQGRDVLADPVAFELVSDGDAADWSVERFNLEHADDGEARYDVALTSDLGRIEGTMTIEFDGFVWYDLELLPAGGAIDVDHARLVMSVPPEIAELRSGDELAGVEGPIHSGFNPYYWIGNERAGVAWIGEGPIDWRVENEEEVFEVQPPGNEAPATLTIHMIDHAVTLDRPMRLQFGLQASPIRPVREDHFVTHLTQSSGPATNADRYGTLADRGGYAWNFHSGWRGRDAGRGIGWGGWPAHPPTQERRDELKFAVLTAHEHGIKATVYTGWGVKAASEEFEHFGHEMVRKPLTSHGFGTYMHSAGLDGAYNDYMAWAIAQLIKEYDIDGVFWDSTANIATSRKHCENLLIGNGWMDHHGEVHRTIPVRAFRKLFRRVYNLVHGELKEDGVVYNFGGSIWAINAYADVFHRGEGRPMHAETLREAWQPLAYYRSNYAGRPFGLHYLAMNKNFRNLPMTVNTHHAVTLLHGLQHTKADGAYRYGHHYRTYERGDRPFPQVWQTRRWLPMDNDVTWFTYYEDQQVVVPEAESLLASAFVSGDGQRAAVVVSNLDQREIDQMPVSLDLEGMGLDPSGSVQVEDAIMKEPVELIDGHTLMLDIESERFRLLRVWVE